MSQVHGFVGLTVIKHKKRKKIKQENQQIMGKSEHLYFNKCRVHFIECYQHWKQFLAKGQHTLLLQGQ